ncbi:hypothetical protein [Bacillus phage SPO1L3]|nr:hypothetical protein [Bacillus phage SPO1L3]
MGNVKEKVLEAFDILERISKTSGANKKREILSEGLENEPLKELLYQTYNNFIIFGIKKVPKVKPVEKSDVELNFKLFGDLLDDLAARRLTGNKAKEAVQVFFSCCDETEQKWYAKIIQRDLKIGITEKTINKVFDNYIPIFECQLAEPFKEKKVPEEYIIDPKLDGYRGLAFAYADRTEFRTRNGKELEGYDLILEEIEHHLPIGYVYDGEIMAPSGKFNDVQRTAFKKAKSKEGIFHIFDMVPIEEWENNSFSEELSVRKDRLAEIMKDCDSALIQLVPVHGPFKKSPESWERVLKLYDEALDEGLEGLMMKDTKAKYKMGKSFNIMKIKPYETIDLRVVGVQEGKEGTQHEGSLGALIVEYKGNTVNVGSGFSHQLRAELWANKEAQTDRIIEIEYKEETTDKNGKHSLREPRFKRFRNDK